MKKIIISVLASIATSTVSAQLVHQFNSPSFSGQGYSSHVLTIEQLEATRRKAIADAQKAAQEKAERDAKNTNLAKFLVNVESRIYAQLSKQLADAMFADSGATNGTMDFQGTTISWVKSGTDVTLTITEANGNRTDITVPLASFSF
jgi:curli production assembly/transport component CsgF